MSTPVGILATACALPSRSLTLAEVCTDEKIDLELSDGARQLGIDSVRACSDESASDLALAAATEALSRAGMRGRDLDLIVDYTVLPQEYVVPAWNLGNKLQHELGATRAVTLGFSGAGGTSSLVALWFAVSLIRAEDNIRTALLFGADAALPGNRVVNPDHPMTLLGDGASAVVLAAGAERDVVLGTKVRSKGSAHDVSLIPSGALANRDRPDLYRLQVDAARYEGWGWGASLGQLSESLLDEVGVDASAVSELLVPNVSASDQSRHLAAHPTPVSPVCSVNRRRYGHVQATDLVLNLHTVRSEGRRQDGELVLLSSHGMGFTTGVAVIRR